MCDCNHCACFNREIVDLLKYHCLNMRQSILNINCVNVQRTVLQRQTNKQTQYYNILRINTVRKKWQTKNMHKNKTITQHSNYIIDKQDAECNNKINTIPKYTTWVCKIQNKT